MTVQQLKMWSRETVRRNRIEPAETEYLSNSQKCLITLHIVGLVIILNVKQIIRNCIIFHWYVHETPGKTPDCIMQEFNARCIKACSKFITFHYF